MTNRTITLAPIDFDANIDLDDLLDLAHDLDLIPESIDYFYDDAHADPLSYLMQSPAFMTANFPTITDPMTIDELAFYDRFDDATITFRMIAESITHEIANPA